MSKIDPPVTSTYVPTEYVTGDQIVKHFGVASVSVLPTEEQQRYLDYAVQSNRKVETTIYKYVDTLPFAITDESLTYSRGLAFQYALWLKATDDGANNVKSLKDAWEGERDGLIKTLKSQPKLANTRRMISNAKGETGPAPYSQAWGVEDIL